MERPRSVLGVKVHVERAFIVLQLNLKPSQFGVKNHVTHADQGLGLGLEIGLELQSAARSDSSHCQQRGQSACERNCM